MPSLIGYDAKREDITEAILNFYFPAPLSELTRNITPIVQLGGDFYFQCPTQRGAELHKKYAPTFLYHYDFKKGLTLYSGFKAFKEEKIHNLQLAHAARQIAVEKVGKTLYNELEYENNIGSGEWGMHQTIGFENCFLIKTRHILTFEIFFSVPGHVDDLLLVFYFGIPIADIPETDSLYPLSKMMTAAIASFMKTPIKNL